MDAAAAGTPDRPPFARRAAASGLGLVLLLAAVALAWAPGLFSVPPIDRDEPRYAQATRQMLESGDFVDIRFQDEPRHVKPVGIYWLQAGAAVLSGEGGAAPIGVYRLVSLVGALAGVALTFWALAAFLAPAAALAATALVAATLVLGVEARFAKTDAVLFATIVAAQGALARIWLARRAGRNAGLALPLAFWAALGLSILLKGPVGPMVAGLTVAGLAAADRSAALLRALRPLTGLLVAAAIAAPWLVAIGLRTDGAFFAASLGEDWWGKVVGAREKHGAPPGAHLLAFLATGWPLVPFAVAAMPAIWRQRRLPAIVFAAAWALPSWLILEAVPTKLPHYLLPLVPAVALAAFAALAGGGAGIPPGRVATAAAGRGWRWGAAALMLVVPVAFAGAAVAVPLVLGELPSTVGAGLVVLAIAPAGLAARRLLAAEPPQRAVLPALAAAALAQVGLCGFVLPEMRMLFPAPRAVAAARALAGCAPARIVAVGYREPSMVFLGGTDTLLADPAEAVAALAADPCAVAVVEARWSEDFLAAATAAHLGVALRGREEGFNINGGRRISLGLYVAVPAGDGR